MRRAVLGLALIPLLAACELFGPGGPGTIDVRILADEAPIGAAVLEVGGPGIREFAAAGGSRVFSRARTAKGGTAVHRVVVLNPASGDLRFRIEVDDLGADPPTMAVVAAADTADRPVRRLGRVRIGIER